VPEAMAVQDSVNESLEHRGFAQDFWWAFRALRSQPSVTVVSLIVTTLIPLWFALDSAVPHLPNLLIMPTVVGLYIVLLGWLGSERVFFLCRFEGRQVTVGHLLRLVKSFYGRFFRLGLVVAAPLMVLGALAGAHIQDANTPALWWTVPVFLVMLAVDFSFTFVPPALAYTTPSVERALRIGFAMIRETWPESALYVLCPPLALGAVNLVTDPFGSRGLQVVTNGVIVFVGLLAKGSIAAFYLRERGARGDDGAASVVEHELAS
jgi:hypothetical protein